MEPHRPYRPGNQRSRLTPSKNAAAKEVQEAKPLAGGAGRGAPRRNERSDVPNEKEEKEKAESRKVRENKRIKRTSEAMSAGAVLSGSQRTSAAMSAGAVLGGSQRTSAAMSAGAALNGSQRTSAAMSAEAALGGSQRTSEAMSARAALGGLQRTSEAMSAGAVFDESQRCPRGRRSTDRNNLHVTQRPIADCPANPSHLQSKCLSTKSAPSGALFFIKQSRGRKSSASHSTFHRPGRIKAETSISNERDDWLRGTLCSRPDDLRGAGTEPEWADRTHRR